MLALSAPYGVFSTHSRAAAKAAAQELRGAPEIEILRAPPHIAGHDPRFLDGPLAAPVRSFDAHQLVALADAARGRPPLRVALSITGEVAQARFFDVPLGTPLSALAGACGARPGGVLWVGDAQQGRPAKPDETADLSHRSLLVLSAHHPLVARAPVDADRELRKVASACGNCRACAELCPPRNQGAPFDPQRALLSLAQGFAPGPALLGALHCSGCGVCEWYACPVGLKPAFLLGQAKARLLAAGAEAPAWTPSEQASDTERARVIPWRRAAVRLGLADIATPQGPLVHFEAPRVSLAPQGKPLVRVGDQVVEGQKLSQGPCFASLSGRVSSVGERIVLQR
jgi:Na+-translocating ferredoxin:NAD+ oxidoreductase RnfC subunit